MNHPELLPALSARFPAPPFAAHATASRPNVLFTPRVTGADETSARRPKKKK